MPHTQSSVPPGPLQEWMQGALAKPSAHEVWAAAPTQRIPVLPVPTQTGPPDADLFTPRDGGQVSGRHALRTPPVAAATDPAVADTETSPDRPNTTRRSRKMAVTAGALLALGALGGWVWQTVGPGETDGSVASGGGAAEESDPGKQVVPPGADAAPGGPEPVVASAGSIVRAAVVPTASTSGASGAPAVDAPMVAVEPAPAPPPAAPSPAAPPPAAPPPAAPPPAAPPAAGQPAPALPIPSWPGPVSPGPLPEVQAPAPASLPAV